MVLNRHYDLPDPDLFLRTVDPFTNWDNYICNLQSYILVHKTSPFGSLYKNKLPKDRNRS